jgi:hypothetical protein
MIRYSRPKYTPWTKQMVDQLIALYPSTSNTDIAATLGCTTHQVYLKARSLSLIKSPAFILSKLIIKN